MSDSHEKEIIVRLNVVINLLLEFYASTAGKTSNAAEKVKALAAMGLDSGEIGKIIGKESKFVAATLSNFKRGKRNGKRGSTSGN